jgi:hypothetical protein
MLNKICEYFSCNKYTNLRLLLQKCIIICKVHQYTGCSGIFGAICMYIHDKHYAGIMAELQNRRVCGEVSSFVYENKIQ